MFYLNRIIAIDSFAAGKENVVYLNGHVNLNGDNGAGKTTFLQLIPPFFGAYPSQLVRRKKTKLPFIEYFLPNKTSYIIYEYIRGDQTCMAVMRSSTGNNTQAQFLLIEHEYERSVFMLQTQQGFEALPSSDLARRVTDKGWVRTSQWLSLSEYRNVIQSNINERNLADKKQQHRRNENRRRFAFCRHGTSIHHIEKVVMGIFGREPSFETFKAIIVSIIQSDEFESESESTELHSTFINKASLEHWTKEYRQLKQVLNKQPQADNLSQMASESLLLRQERSRVASLVVQLMNDVESVLAEKVQHGDELYKQSHDHNDYAVQCQREWTSKVIELEAEITAIEKTITALESDHKSYQSINIEYLKQLVSRIPQRSTRIEELNQQISRLKTGAESIELEYSDLKHGIEKTFDARIRDREETFNHDSAQLTQRKDKLTQQYREQQSHIRAEANQKRETQEALKIPLVGRIEALKVMAENPPLTDEQKSELAAKQRAVKELIEQKQRYDQQHVSESEKIRHLDAQVSELESQLQGEKTRLQGVEARYQKLLQYQSPNEHSLLYFLRTSQPDWISTVGKVIQPELLLRTDLQPQQLSSTDTLYGAEINLDAISTLDLVDEEKLQNLLSENRVQEKASQLAISGCQAKQEKLARQCIKQRKLVQQAQYELKTCNSKLLQANQAVQELEHKNQEYKSLLSERYCQQAAEKQQQLQSLEQDSRKISEQCELDYLASQQQEKDALNELGKQRENLLSRKSHEINGLKSKQEKTLAENDQERMRALKKGGVDTETLRKQEQEREHLKAENKQAFEAREVVEKYQRWSTDEWPRHPEYQQKRGRLGSQLIEYKRNVELQTVKLEDQTKQFKQQLTKVENQIRQTKENQLVCQSLQQQTSPYFQPHIIVEKSEADTLALIQHQWQTVQKRLDDLNKHGGKLFYTLKKVFLQEMDTNTYRLWQQLEQEHGHNDDWLVMAEPLSLSFQTELKQLQATLFAELSNTAESIRYFYQYLSKFEQNIQHKSQQLSKQLANVRAFEAIENIQIRLASKVKEEAYWPLLRSFLTGYDDWQIQNQSLLPQALVDNLLELAQLFSQRSQNHVDLTLLFNLEVDVVENGHAKKAVTGAELVDISSTGLSYLILIQIFIALTNLLRGKSNTMINWPVDELGNFSRYNSAKLLATLTENDIAITSAFPDPDPELLGEYKHTYYIEKPGRDIVTFVAGHQGLSASIEAILNGEEAHV
ncbi:MAG: ATP-binding protein [Photobacterium frigidiphilum]|uniref:ATP-binding protein n=1 Tax=Photobacterium frigidiphilum TaxID=264736 RepID=UPI00300297B7